MVRRLGAHLSIAGGMYKAVESTVEKGGNALQIFSSSPRMWFSNLPKMEEVDRFNQLSQKHDVRPVFIHAKYLVNLASDNEKLVDKSIKSLEFDLQVGEMIDAIGVVVHLGSHMGRGFGEVKLNLVKRIKSVLGTKKSKVKLLIENSAGQQGKIASQLSEIGFLLRAVNTKRVGWCLDSCHAWAAGFFCGKGSGKPLIGSDIVKQAEDQKILDRLELIHINDSRDEFGLSRDRHENLGMGKMGKEQLSCYVNHPKLKHLPLITEVPGFDHLGPDKKNLDILKSLIDV